MIHNPYLVYIIETLLDVHINLLEHFGDLALTSQFLFAAVAYWGMIIFASLNFLNSFRKGAKNV